MNKVKPCEKSFLPPNFVFKLFLQFLMFITGLMLGWHLLKTFLNNLSALLSTELYVEYWASLATLNINAHSLFAYRLNWLAILISATIAALVNLALLFITTRLYGKLSKEINATDAPSPKPIKLILGPKFDEWPFGPNKYLYLNDISGYFFITFGFILSLFLIFFVLNEPISNINNAFSLYFSLSFAFFYSYCIIRMILLSSLRLTIAAKYWRFATPTQVFDIGPWYVFLCLGMGFLLLGALRRTFPILDLAVNNIVHLLQNFKMP